VITNFKPSIFSTLIDGWHRKLKIKVQSLGFFFVDCNMGWVQLFIQVFYPTISFKIGIETLFAILSQVIATINRFIESDDILANKLNGFRSRAKLSFSSMCLLLNNQQTAILITLSNLIDMILIASKRNYKKVYESISILKYEINCAIHDFVHSENDKIGIYPDDGTTSIHINEFAYLERQNVKDSNMQMKKVLHCHNGKLVKLISFSVPRWSNDPSSGCIVLNQWIELRMSSYLLLQE